MDGLSLRPANRQRRQSGAPRASTTTPNAIRTKGCWHRRTASDTGRSTNAAEAAQLPVFPIREAFDLCWSSVLNLALLLLPRVTDLPGAIYAQAARALEESRRNGTLHEHRCTSTAIRAPLYEHAARARHTNPIACDIPVVGVSLPIYQSAHDDCPDLA